MSSEDFWRIPYAGGSATPVATHVPAAAPQPYVLPEIPQQCARCGRVGQIGTDLVSKMGRHLGVLPRPELRCADEAGCAAAVAALDGVDEVGEEEWYHGPSPADGPERIRLQPGEATDHEAGTIGNDVYGRRLVGALWTGPPAPRLVAAAGAFVPNTVLSELVQPGAAAAWPTRTDAEWTRH